MIVGPAGFEQIAHASTLYSELDTSSWGTHNRIIEYGEWDGTSGRTGNFTLGYDANGSVTKKITWDTHGTTTDPIDHTKIEEVTYEYNLQNRLKRVVSDSDPVSGTNVVDVVDYKYNDAGIRVEKYTFKVAQNYLGTADEQTNATDKKTTIYLVEQYNHTGYTQVLEEAPYEKADPDIATDTPASRITYTIGDDVITQAKAVYNGGDPTDPANWTFNDPQHQLYDGHGSTRQLVTSSVPNTTIVDDFSYDGYGVLLQDEDNFPPNGTQNPGKVAQQATNLLYAGEHFDTDSQNYYLRARWYNPLSGRFNRMDPYAGNNQDPQSLHKYLYCHANPINNIDPSGKITLASALFRVGLGLLLTSIFMTSFHGAYRRAKSVAARKNQTSVFNSIFKGAFTWNDWKYVLSGFGAGLEAGFINAFDTLTVRLVDPLNEYRDYLWQREGLEESWIGATANGFAWAGTASVYAAAAVWTWSAAGMGTMDIAVSKAGSPYFFHVQYGVNGVWQHAAGSIGNMWILPVRNVAGVVITGWPVLYPQAVMDAQTAFSCLTAATSAIARGWGV